MTPRPRINIRIPLLHFFGFVGVFLGILVLAISLFGITSANEQHIAPSGEKSYSAQVRTEDSRHP